MQGKKSYSTFFEIFHYFKEIKKKSFSKLIQESSNLLILLKIAFWAILISMFDPLSPIYPELQRLQISEITPFFRVPWRNGANSSICNRSNSEHIGLRGSNMEIEKNIKSSEKISEQVFHEKYSELLVFCFLCVCLSRIHAHYAHSIPLKYKE